MILKSEIFPKVRGKKTNSKLKLDHFPRVNGKKNKYLSCHHLDNYRNPQNPPIHGLVLPTKICLVVSTHLKNISQNGNLPQIGVKCKILVATT